MSVDGNMPWKKNAFKTHKVPENIQGKYLGTAVKTL